MSDGNIYELKFSHHVVEHLGLKLYQNKPTNVIAELVSNSWDALATNVEIKIAESDNQSVKHAIPGKGRSTLPARLRPLCHRNRDQGFTNTYGRMEWDLPSSTITAGCLSPSKGRFGHPEELRTISLREAALLQTFPSSYKFVGNRIDAACSVVGNALPCLFAEAIAGQVATTIGRTAPWLKR